MFARPRIKRNALVAPAKKRKRDHAIEEISFDKDARADYLTGFHKRKQQRIKHAQEAATEKARQDKIEFRKQLREERQQAVEKHVQDVTALLREAQKAGQEDAPDSASGSEDDDWEGITDEPVPAPELVDHTQEFIDEDRYTSVTIEPVEIDREGIHRPTTGSQNEEEPSQEPRNEGSTRPTKKHPPKKKKKKFRYESAAERKLAKGKPKNSRARR